MDSFETKIGGCARCGEAHDRLKFQKLIRPIKENTHWATCPTTGEPIVLSIVLLPGGDDGQL